jgi:hypothetical protein
MAVASVVYNMAGDAANRQDYLKSLIVKKVFSKGPESMGDTISNGLLHGPAMQMRSFYRWASTPSNYPSIGLPSSDLNRQNQLNAVVNTGVPGGQRQVTKAYEVGPPAAVWWAKRWILANRSADFLLNWKSAFNADFTSVIITFPDGSPAPLVETVSVTSPGYDASKLYISFEYTWSGTSSINRQFIYQMGSGQPGPDSYHTAEYNAGYFFPSVPVRLSNAFLGPSTRMYQEAQEAYERMTGGASYAELIEKVSDNPSLGDIDYIFVTLGVTLNVRENSPKEYLYRFFVMLMQLQNGGGAGSYDAWVARGYTSTPAITEVKIGGFGSLVFGQYASSMNWRFIDENTGVGLAKPSAKLGELWFEKMLPLWNGYPVLRLYWQKTLSSYSYLDLISLRHKNHVYGYSSESVETTAFQAIDDPEESGFIVPIHYNTWRDMSLVQASRMAASCTFIVFNCIEIYKEQWYETGIFKILLVVVIAVASVVFTGGAGLGILGAHLALGTALGFTGLTAAIVGAVANALAAMILISLLEPTLQRAFGSMAPVIGAIIMFAIGAAAGSLTSTGTIVIDWSNLLRADNLLAMTQAVGAGITSQVNQDTLKLQQSGLDYQENAQAEINKIQQAFFKEFGYGAGVIDPMMLVDAPKGPIAESSSTFLTRTLMTGSEIAEMSRQLLYEFPAYSLKLPDAFT